MGRVINAVMVHNKLAVSKIIVPNVEISAETGASAFREIAAETEAEAGAEVVVSDGRPDVRSLSTVGWVVAEPVPVALAVAAGFMMLLGVMPLDELKDDDCPTRRKFLAIGLLSLAVREKSETLKVKPGLDELAKTRLNVSKSCGWL
jgi:hypothetical protein